MESSKVYTGVNWPATSSLARVISGVSIQRVVTVWKSPNQKRPTPKVPAWADREGCALPRRVRVRAATFPARTKVPRLLVEPRRRRAIRTLRQMTRHLWISLRCRVQVNGAFPEFFQNET